MSNQFTKEEVINLLGKKVQLKKRIISEHPHFSFILFEKGIQGEVYLIENDPEELVLNVLIDGQYEPFNKVKFHEHWQILNSEPAKKSQSFQPYFNQAINQRQFVSL